MVSLIWSKHSIIILPVLIWTYSVHCSEYDLSLPLYHIYWGGKWSTLIIHPTRQVTCDFIRLYIKTIWNVYVIHTGPVMISIIFSFIMVFFIWGTVFTLVLYTTLKEKFIKKHYRLSKRKNILFSNWSRRIENVVKGIKFKSEGWFVSIISYYIFWTVQLKLVAYFFLNPASFLFYLLIFSIFSCVLFFIYIFLECAASVVTLEWMTYN